jgi:hypothetical protein
VWTACGGNGAGGTRDDSGGLGLRRWWTSQRGRGVGHVDEVHLELRARQDSADGVLENSPNAQFSLGLAHHKSIRTRPGPGLELLVGRTGKRVIPGRWVWGETG